MTPPSVSSRRRAQSLPCPSLQRFRPIATQTPHAPAPAPAPDPAPEPVRRFGAGRVVPAGDVDALTDAARELLDDPQALANAREGARRARESLTWTASAHAHLELYRELA